jgi:4-amino-4-deoxy-L-arabinose transferase-like glycosyltransferase
MINRHFLFLVILAIATFSANFWGYPVYILDEVKNASCAMEMDHRNNWVIPTFNNELRTDKPPLHYFLMIAAYQVAGVNPFGARLFSVLAGLGTALLIFGFARKFINRETAFWSTLIFISSIQVSIQFHLAVPDPFLIFFCTAALASFAMGWMEKRYIYLYGMYAATALAFLAKGPVALILIGTPILCYLIVTREFSWSLWIKLRLLLGMVIFLGIALPWFIAVTIQTDGQWLKDFVLDHNIHRFSSTMEGHKGIPGIAVISLLAGLLPLSLFLPQAMREAWQSRKTIPALNLCFWVCVIVVLFFSLSRTFLPGYIAPAFPFASIILGFFIDRWLKSGDSNVAKSLSYIIGAIFSLSLPFVAYVALRAELPAVASRAFLLFPISIGGIVGLYFFVRKSWDKALYFPLLGYLVGSVMLFYTIIPALLQENPLNKLMVATDVSQPWAIYKSTNPAIVFKGKKTLPVLENPYELEKYRMLNPRSMIFTRKSHLENVDTTYWQVESAKDLFETSITTTLRSDN